MRNFTITDAKTGKEYWISRSVAAIVIFTAYNSKNEKCVLAVKRGKGTPDPEYVGCYCLPCGYVDFDETIEEAAMRELREETGIVVSQSKFNLVGINDNPKEDKRQNISFRYLVESNLTVEMLQLMFSTKDSEKDEVDEIRMIPISSVNLYEWAFNHEALIGEYT